MSKNQNYFLTDNISINEELLSKICNFAFGHKNNFIASTEVSSFLFKGEDAGKTVKKPFNFSSFIIDLP